MQAMPRHAKDPGLAAVERYHRAAQIDAEWDAREERGFSWWGHFLRQRVWADPPAHLEGRELVRVHAATDLLRDVDEEGIAGVLGALGTHAAVNGLLYDAEERRVRMVCSATFHEDNVGWLGALFASSAALQASMAHDLAPQLARALGAEIDASEHPESGPRDEPDDMLNWARTLAGREPSWDLDALGRELGTVSGFLNAHGFLSHADERGLTAEFPWGPDDGPAAAGGRSSLLMLSLDQPHPQLGPGALLRLFLPSDGDPADLADVALELNRREEDPDAVYDGGYNFGQWCVGPLPAGAGQGLVYVTFLSAHGLREGLMLNMAFSMETRTRWARKFVPQELVDAWPLADPSAHPNPLLELAEMRVSDLVERAAALSESLSHAAGGGDAAGLVEGARELSTRIEELLGRGSGGYFDAMVPILSGLRAAIERGAYDEAQTYALPLAVHLREVRSEIRAAHG